MSDFEQSVEEALESLPPDLRGFMSNVAVVVEEEPPAGLPLLGLYQGRIWALGARTSVLLERRARARGVHTIGTSAGRSSRIWELEREGATRDVRSRRGAAAERSPQSFYRFFYRSHTTRADLSRSELLYYAVSRRLPAGLFRARSSNAFRLTARSGSLGGGGGITRFSDGTQSYLAATATSCVSPNWFVTKTRRGLGG